MIKTLAILGFISTALVGCMVAPYDDRPHQGRYDRNPGHNTVYRKDSRHPSYNRGNSELHRNDSHRKPDVKWQNKKWEKDRKQWEKDRKQREKDYKRDHRR